MCSGVVLAQALELFEKLTFSIGELGGRHHLDPREKIPVAVFLQSGHAFPRSRNSCPP